MSQCEKQVILNTVPLPSLLPITPMCSCLDPAVASPPIGAALLHLYYRVLSGIWLKQYPPPFPFYPPTDSHRADTSDLPFIQTFVLSWED
jgi:hypothetical protein